MALYELNAEFAALMNEIEAAEGELTEELDQRLEALRNREPRELESAIRLVLNVNAEADALRNEATRLQKRAKSLEALSARVKELLKQNLELNQLEEAHVGIHKLRIQRNGGKPPLEWLPGKDETNLPMDCVRVKLEIISDEVRRRLEDNDPKVVGVVQVGTVGTHLRVV
jgi:hypothetical protein